ncbi:MULTISPECIES: O-methyltransferase [Nostocales]|uniref:SAM-dependent methlyltransferase n=3 Tax=Nostocales TaxID=1161 RepID=A0A0C1R4D5_9CYAN|nr:class I SAM-dependent methyltransferase [Tolypothrix bouteillei]KAF3889392.1 SAM-dependent methyltransferase [Tolypothrix bouteillei VB521301]
MSQSQVAEKPIARPVTPLGILAKQLETVLLTLDGKTSSQLAAEIDVAYRLSAGLDPYLEECTTSESPALAALAEKTACEAWGQRFDEGTTVRELEQEMLSGHVEGQILKMFVYMTKAKKILEIGMFTGYSALAMAEALPSDGELVACEIDQYTAEFARSAFQASPHGEKIRVEVGGALEILQKLAADGQKFDFVFVDADKKEYVKYFHTLLEKDLLVPGGFICVDNTLLQGQVYLSPENRTPNGEAIANFNRTVADDPRVEQVLLPLRDGLTIIRRI